MSIYRNIFLQAWQIVWKNKFLWFFGLFISILGVGAESVFFVSFVSRGVMNGVHEILIDSGVNSFGTLASNLISVATNYPLNFGIIMTVYMIFLVLLIFLIWLIVTSQVAVNKETALIYSGDITPKSITTSIADSRPYFWSILLIGYGLRIAVILFLFRIGEIFYNLSLKGGGLFLFIIAFIVIATLIFLAGIYFKFVINYLIISNRRLKNAFQEAFDLLRHNWLQSVELSLSMYAIIFVLGILSALALVNIYWIFEMIALTLVTFSGTLGFLTAVIVRPLAAIIFMGWVMAILGAFQVSSWAIFFVNLNGQGVVSKIVRLAERFKK